jgi:hypothetical protein
MMHSRASWALIKNELMCWAHRRSSFVVSMASIILLILSLMGEHAHQVPLFVAILGGPSVGVSYGHLGEARNGWTWFLINVFFAVSISGLIDSGSSWVRLTLIRDGSRLRWAAARLFSILLVALGFLAILVAVIALGVIGGHSEPLITRSTLWEIGLWALGLICIGWCEAAITLLTGSLWLALSTILLLLVFAGFGGSLAPFMPFAQWIVGMHNLPGTMGVSGGSLYLAAWTTLAGATALWVAHRSHIY